MPTKAANPVAPMLAKLREQGDVYVAIGLVSFLVIMVIPLPPLVLDMLLALSIAGSLLVLLVTFYVVDPVDFSLFPTILLATTLFRLSLNVASTRLILLHGATGQHAAGNIIRTFGQVVVGGSYVVGLVVFIILVIINFVVITKGAGRVSEVAARFTLDAMPGKQMAIDGELNSGLIDEREARRRREAVTREADFYGAMDGASKFIRGDAIAGILITLINIVGGIIIGVVQNGLPLLTAVENYTVLTIGDGLVSQIPALIVSAASGMLVTRIRDEEDRTLQQQVGVQLFGAYRPLALLTAALFGFVLIPGLQVPFSILGFAAGYAAWRGFKADPAANGQSAKADPAADKPAEASDEPPVETLLRVEPLTFELGVDLIGLVDERHGGTLVERIQRIRRQIAQDLGLLVPSVHLRDNLRLQGGEYVILLRGEEVARGKVVPRQLLAINPGDATSTLKGVKGTDPVFGLDAVWIPEAQRMTAQNAGYTVVDVPTVLTTHLTEVLQQHGHELYGRQQLADVLEQVGKDNPRLIEELVPEPLSRGVLLRVFRNLIREGVSVRDSQTILEGLADHARRVQDPDVLTEFVRQKMARHLTRRFAADDGVLRYIGLAPDTEDALASSLHGGEGGAMSLGLDPEQARRLLTGLRDAAEAWRGPGEAVVLCPPLARGPLRRLTEKIIPRVPVLSPAELLPSVRLERVAVVSLKK